MDVSDRAHWIQDIHRLLPVRVQSLLTGNIRDPFITPFV